MSKRGLVVALLCGLLGVAAGALVGFLAEPRPSYGDRAVQPVPGVSPSLPTAGTSRPPYAPDNDYPTLSADLALPIVHTIHNRLATWTYHVPQGWLAFDSVTNKPLSGGQITRSSGLRFKPAGAPDIGDYSLYVRMVNNTVFDSAMSVAAKIAGFGEASGVADYSVLHRTPSSVFFEYRDATTNLHRYNFFQWFAVPGDPYATLMVSVAGRKRDIPGLKALLARFADNVTGEDTPRPPPTSPATTPTSPSTSSSTSTPSG